jgi:high affinity Mn2+ porin
MRARDLLCLVLSAVLISPAYAADADSILGWTVPDWLNVHAQNTEIVQTTPSFPAQYSGPHSLNDAGETKETVSVDLLVGARLWSGGELHVDALMWQGFGLSRTTGALAFPNGEAFKAGTTTPDVMFSRLFVRHTIGFGGEQEDVPDGPLTLAGKQDISRLTLTVGRMSFLDVFDHNTYAGDPRSQFMNWGLMANLTWDYGQDSIGYSLGATAELNQPDWTLRYGFFEMPAYINAGNVGSGNGGEDQFLTYPPRGSFAPIDKSYAMAVEYEQRYSLNSHPGAVRLLAWLDDASRDSYYAATTILQSEGPSADLSSAQGYHHSYGLGLNSEQEITKSVGVFSRLGWNNGKAQALEFSDANWSASLGVSIKGDGWNRADDTIGVGGVVSGLSSAFRKYLTAGGLGIELGDGTLNYGPEKALETYYNVQLSKGIQTTLDYQFISNPGANRARGPVNIFGFRFHYEL